MSSASPRRTRRLFVRIYLNGLMLLALVVVATAGASWLLGNRFPMRVHAWLAAQRVTAELDPTRQVAHLEQRVKELHDLSQAVVVVYDAAGRRIASASHPVPGPLSPRERAQMVAGRMIHRGVRVLNGVPLADGKYLLLSWSGTDALLRIGATLLVILVVVAVTAIPLTRAITRPLRRITDTAWALGDGDLMARTGVQRKDELGQLARVLDQMAGRLQRTVEGEKALWANISHEIRTPLSRIRVALELCEEEGELAAVQGHLAGISQDLTELDRLVDDVLMTARLDLSEDGLVLHRHAVSMAAVAQEAGRRFGEWHPGRVLRQQLPPDLPAVAVDEALLLRALANLLDNAAKYSEPETEIELVLACGEQQLDVQVLDRGIGVEPQDLPRLFDHFFRTDRSRSRGTGGSGLGLALCRRIVEAHGGSITAKGRDGGGLTVHLTLPLHTSSRTRQQGDTAAGHRDG